MMEMVFPSKSISPLSLAVTAINFVTEDSIEHSILHLLAHKQTLADGVLDGTGDFSEIKMPSGRAALIERMQAMLGQAKADAGSG